MKLFLDEMFKYYANNNNDGKDRVLRCTKSVSSIDCLYKSDIFQLDPYNKF